MPELNYNIADSINETEGGDQYLVFTVGQQKFAVQLLSVREVTEAKSCERIPNCSQNVVGMTDLHGEIVCVVDLSALLSSSPCRSGALAMIVAKTPHGTVGGLVDDLHGVCTITPEQILPEPATATRERGASSLGVGRLESGLVTLIDLHHVLASCAVLEPKKN